MSSYEKRMEEMARAIKDLFMEYMELAGYIEKQEAAD